MGFRVGGEVYDGVRPGIGSEVYKILGVENALAAFRSVGSTAPGEVERQLSVWKARLGLDGVTSA